MSVIVEFECDYAGCNEGYARSWTGTDANRDSIDVNMRNWETGTPINTYLPEGWTVFGTETLFTYCPKHSQDKL